MSSRRIAGTCTCNVTTPDSELLARYAAGDSQAAFAELVRRHVDVVFASARRQLRDTQLAEDVTQAVFLLLARRARTLRADVIVPAWLLKAVWFACRNVRRRETRRR